MQILTALLTDYTFRTVALGAALMGLLSGAIGSFAVLRGQGLLGDGVSHAALPGVVLAFLLTGSKHTEVLLLGALVTGFFAAVCITAIVRGSRIHFDSALALVMSVFFGLGMALLTYVQKIPDASQAGLSRFLFGQASALLRRDLVFMLISAVVLLGLTILFWKEFKLLAFDRAFAKVSGYPVERLEMLLSFMTVAGIVIGLQTVGVILMSAMLITPAVAARQWCGSLFKMLLLSAFFGALSGVAGTAASSLVPQLPTGPAIVAVISIIALVSLLFAPGRGIVWRLAHRKRLSKQQKEEQDVAAI